MTVSLPDFISHWHGADGGERSQSQSFLLHFCQALGLAEPRAGDYKFEYDVKGEKARNFIDLYKRGCFVLESKQSRARRQREESGNQQDLLPLTDTQPRRDRASRAWDVLMNNARQQAENYARHLPPDHEWPPFIIVCDVGHCFELYADFTGKGRNYTQFPDRQGFRIYLEDIAKPEVQAMFRAIWEDPHSLDPTRRAVKATREVAERLAAVSKHMEQRKLPAEYVAAFLMRCIFTMFAEDVELLPSRAFSDLLKRAIDKPHIFAPELEMLWAAMDKGGYASAAEMKVKQFNGNLFKHAPAFPLEREEIGELLEAASKDWREVDPSIFGTLLEQALDPETRARLGAHYTPRAYVERLVVATVIEPLRAEWLNVLASAERLNGEGKQKEAIAAVQVFHEKLYNTHVLDPACGTGNFLYVALELMKRLEGDVVEALLNLGGQQALAGLDRHEVDPHQFLGLELNARARHIAELVLWIGYLQWHIRNTKALPGDPVLKDYGNIRHMDAVLAHDGVDAKGNYINPRKPDWPEADYIVGNPPFMGGNTIRARLGDPYATALWSSHSHMKRGCDLVMYWWDMAANILTRPRTRLQRFGFVTTNSITQVFQRSTVERYLGSSSRLSIILAIPDHPWTKVTKNSAAVRIAMTVAARGEMPGHLKETCLEEKLDTDNPRIEFIGQTGQINADLTVGVDATSSVRLDANRGLAFKGMQLNGQGFLLDRKARDYLREESGSILDEVVHPYLNGRDIMQRSRDLYVIDAYPLSRDELRVRFPKLYQILLSSVKPERDFNRQVARRDNWWWFGQTSKWQREAVKALDRYIATARTAKYRVFSFIDSNTISESKIVLIASDDPYHLGVVSSRYHIVFSERMGGWLGVGNDSTYQHTDCFDPFPFPNPDEFTRARIASLAEKLDAHRKQVQAHHQEITLTQMYNVLEAVRSGAALSPAEARIRDVGLVLVLKDYHDELDAAVAQAYGWPANLPEDEVLVRLVALNKARAAEEAKGHVRWLRPDYQIPRFGSPREKQEQADLGLVPAAIPVRSKPAFPSGAVEQTGAVMAALAAATSPQSARDIAEGFRQGRKVEPQVRAALAAMARMGFIAVHDGGTRFAALRAA
ncbi:class I SAM-dependent DNA methyltransferase [Aestuariivirga sp.]|uniref:class I SAM-dependent DNA methyltransferase n=1 Tax=Aestuariivirga sp. TaxID=2650926 RepID=UPI003783F109